MQPPDRLQHLCFEGKPKEASSHFPTLSSAGQARESFRGRDAACSDQLVVWLLAQAGMDAGCYRHTPLSRRIPACLRALRAPSPEVALARLREDPNLIPKALDVVLLGVTEFFRDRAVFAELAVLLPSIKSRRGTLRVLSASCSNGAELYSLAMLLADAELLDGVELLGLDCREGALEQARQGIYDRASLRTVPDDLIVKYFEPHAGKVRICRQIRDRCAFEAGDLLKGCPEGPWDVILWRNTAIYLSSQAAEKVWMSLASHLTPQGILVTGKAERPPQQLKLRRIHSSVYERGGEE